MGVFLAVQRNVQIRESLDNTYVDDRFKWVKNMKYCLNCEKKFDTEDELCPNCGVKLCEMLQDADDKMNENEAAEIISTMMITGIL